MKVASPGAREARTSLEKKPIMLSTAEAAEKLGIRTSSTKGHLVADRVGASQKYPLEQGVQANPVYSKGSCPRPRDSYLWQAMQTFA